MKRSRMIRETHHFTLTLPSLPCASWVIFPYSSWQTLSRGVLPEKALSTRLLRVWDIREPFHVPKVERPCITNECNGSLIRSRDECELRTPVLIVHHKLLSSFREQCEALVCSQFLHFPGTFAMSWFQIDGHPRDQGDRRHVTLIQTLERRQPGITDLVHILKTIIESLYTAHTE